MTRGSRWTWLISATAGLGVLLVLAFLLSLATRGGVFYERHFVWLFWVNTGVAALLAAVVLFAGVRLSLRLRQGKFGSRLLLKLAAIFALVGLLPGVMIYTVSYQFVSRSIEAWFDVRVAGALDAGLGLGKSTLDALSNDLANKAQLAAERLIDTRSATLPLALERLREQFGAREVSVVSATGQVVASAGGSTGAISPERPSATLLRQARATGISTQIESLDEESLAPTALASPRVQALVALPSTEIRLGASEERYLLVSVALPRALAVNALSVQAAYSEYQQRALARDGLRRMYIGTLTLALVLAVFGAVLLALLLGIQLVKPLLLLADGVREVAAGDLTAKPVFASRDELGGLTRSFAQMTQQLSEARAQVQRGVAQLEGARTRLQTILDNLTAGVMLFDREGRLDSLNPGATRILRLPLSAWVGQRLAERPELQDFAKLVDQRFELLVTSPEAGDREHWQDALELRPGTTKAQMLLLRGAMLPGQAQLLVFDDITEVVSAQRSQAWAEVARRLAHEIKNPLTPIQLSAERLQFKLEDKLEGADQALLVRSVATIVNQVQAMQQLVNEFRDYARLPASQMKPLDLNELVGEVLALYGHAIDAGQLATTLAPGLPRIRGDATQLRQVIHNLVQNGLDAVSDRPGGQVRVQTSRAMGEDGQLRAVRLTVLDNGPGFADNVLQRAFEPYVTTKAKGTGLGLAVVKKIADEHRARLRVANLHEADDPDRQIAGARVSLSFSDFAPAVPVEGAGPAPAPGGATQVH